MADTDFLKAIWDLTNNERRRNNLPDLVYNWKLGWAAMKHSANMANKDFYDHRDLGERVKAEGYAGPMAENIFAGPSSPEAAMKGWMDSPGHRNNILNPGYTDIGVGYYFLENDQGAVKANYYWTQIFGTSR